MIVEFGYGGWGLGGAVNRVRRGLHVAVTNELQTESQGPKSPTWLHQGIYLKLYRDLEYDLRRYIPELSHIEISGGASSDKGRGTPKSGFRATESSCAFPHAAALRSIPPEIRRGHGQGTLENLIFFGYHCLDCRVLQAKDFLGQSSGTPLHFLPEDES